MLGNRKNRAKAGMFECVYGCCRAFVTGDKNKTKRVIRTREKRQWRKDAKED
jgi:hypothetical protein